MSNNSSARGTAKLRLLIADIISDNFKAYDLPDLGQRFGLRPGTEGEAMNSKRRYVMSRLNALNDQELSEVAYEISKEFQNDELEALLSGVSPSDGSISAALGRFDKDVVHKRWEAALERRSTDPEGAITLARTLLEDVIKWLLTKQKIQYNDRADLPTLYRLIAANLNLAPDAHTEDVFKQILGSCQSVVISLGSLRNRLSDSHSPGPLRAKPLARHAELAVNLSGAMTTFLISTWEARNFQ